MALARKSEESMASPILQNGGLFLDSRLTSIWDQLSSFRVADSEAALLFLLAELKELVAADDAVWLGVVRMAHGEAALKDHQLGWRGRAVVHLEWTELKGRVVAASMKAQEAEGGVPSWVEMAKHAGHFRAVTLRELHDMDAFVQTEHYRTCFEPFDITDRMWCVCPVNEDCEVAYIFDRFGDRPRFGEKEKSLLSAAVRPLKWFHRKTVLIQGIALAFARLSPRERSLCAHLLQERSEKQIAESLGLTVATTRSYTQSLYRKFGVHGRIGLMALWLGSPQ